MRMKKILSAVLCVMAFLAVGSNAWALSYTDHVSVAPNGKGDVLIVPLYMAANGWTTRIAVVNTSTTRSTVAKVVVRSYYFSEELLDFLIYLSPTDMWIGYMRYNSQTGNTEVYSEDSSVLYDSGMSWKDLEKPFATSDNPMHGVIKATKCTNDYNGMGYVEIIEGWSAAIVFTTEQQADKQKRGKWIAESYENQAGAGIYNVQNILTGVVDIDVEVGAAAWTASNRMLALKNYQSSDYLSAINTTYLGVNANNNLREVDVALNKDNVAMPFVNGAAEGYSLHMFTFPTKGSQYYQNTDKSCSFIDNLSVKMTARSGYFPLGEVVTYAPSVYDNEEKKAGNPFSPPKKFELPWEVSFVDTRTVIFDKGWINYDFPGPRETSVTSPANAVNKSGQVLDYTGAPVIPFVLDFRTAMSVKDVGYDDGVV